MIRGKKMNTEFEEFDVSFKIVSNKNENVYCEGYVTINDEEAEDVDWYYWTGNGYDSRPYYHHDAEQITGLTREQSNEIDEFINDYMDDALWIDDAILQSEEDEDRTYVRKNCTLIINEGAKLELVDEINYNPNDNPFGDMNFYALLSFKYNGKVINWDEEYLQEVAERIDDTYAGEGKYSIINDTTIEIEIYGGYDEELDMYVGLSGANEESRELIKEHLEDVSEVYKKQLISNLGVFGIACSYISEYLYSKRDMKRFDQAYIQDWGSSVEDDFESYSINELFFMTSEDVEKIIKENHEEELQEMEDAQRDYEREQEELQKKWEQEFL